LMKNRRAPRASASAPARSTGWESMGRRSKAIPRRERDSLALAEVGQSFLS
jgi:hypothetical protein